MRKIALLCLVVGAALVGARAGIAYFTAPLADGSSGAGAATSLEQGPTPTAVVSSSREVTVSWGQTTFASGAAAPGYVVTRYDANSPFAAQTLSSGCTGVIVALTCTETGVPPGSWRYTVTPVAGSNWVGAEGSKSGAVIIGSALLTLTSTIVGPAPLPKTAAGSLSGFAANEGISFRLDNPITGTALSGSPATADSSGNAGVSITIPSGVGDGSHTIYAVGDTSPYPAQASAAIIVDTTAPTSQATGVDANWHNAAVAVTLSAADGSGSGVASIQYTVDGGTLQTISGASGVLTIPAPADHTNDGSHTMSFYGTDLAGNVEGPAKTATVKIDTTPPATTIATTPATADGTNGWFKQSSASFTLAASDPAPASGVAHTYYTVDGGATQLYAGAVTISTQGDHTVDYWSVDNAGNTETTNATHIKLDNVAPATTLTKSPATANGLAGWYVATAPTFSLSAADASSGVASSFYSIDGGATHTYSGPVSVSTDGTHTIGYWSVDNAGNTESAGSATMSVDLTPPATTDNSASITNAWFNVSKTVTLSPSDAASGVASTRYTSDGSTPTSSSSAGTSVLLASDGVYTVKYFSTDNAGNNESVKTAGTQIRIDKTAPAPAAIGLSGAYANGGITYVKNGQALTDAATDTTVNGASSGVASVAYYYCSGASCMPTTPIGSSTAGPSYSVTWTSQPADGTYRLRATVTDTAGNSATSAIVDVTVDNTPPATTDNSASTGNTWTNATQTVTLTPADASSGVASTHYTIDGSTPTSSSSSGTSVSLTGDGLWSVKYFSTDHVGNDESVKTAGTTIRIDKTAPTPATTSFAGAYVSGGGTTYIKTGQALTNGATDSTVNSAASGVKQIAYYYCSGSCTPNPGNAGTTQIGSASTTGPSYSVTWNNSGLSDGAYSVLARVTDNAGNTADATVVHVTVDNAPPATTDNSSTITNTWFNTTKTVTLTPNDNGGSGVPAGSTFYTSNGTAPTTSSSAGTSVALTSDGVYTVKYFSVDNLGNSESVKTAGTQIRIDETNPTPAAIATTGAYTSGGTTYIKNGQALTDAATDPTVNGASSGVKQVDYYYCAGSPCTPTTLIGTSTTGSGYSVAWSSQPADGVYTILARVTDNAGNTAGSTVSTVTIDNTGPTVSETLADATANQAGYINGGGTFYAYANVSDSGAGVNASTITANLSGQCSSCSAVTLSSTGGPFTVLNGSGSSTATYTYRSAALTAVASPTVSFSVTAADNLANSTTQAGTVTIDGGANPGAPSAVTLTTGVSATSYSICAVTSNGYVNAANASSETITVTTASNSPANGIVKLTVGGSPHYQVVPGSGTQTLSFGGLDLSGLSDGAVSLVALEYSPGGNGTSGTKSQSVTKLTVPTAVSTASLTYTDNTGTTADQVAGSNGAGPGSGFLAFLQSSGAHSGSTAFSGQLGAGGNFAKFGLFAETATPTYSVTSVDAACNKSSAASWSPADTK